MSTGAERFIEELAKREALSESVIKRLWDKVANSSSVPSARALATFLVDKGHLSREDADLALAASKPKRKPRPKAEDKPKPKKPAETVEIGDRLSATTDSSQAEAEKKSPRKYKKRTKGDNEFDTPLMLLGGGGLVLLVLCGVGILYLLFSESGDEALKNARTAFEAGSYNQAASDYERFLEKFSSHEGRSIARVTLGIARIRGISESNSEARLKKAQQEIPRIEDEEEFLFAQEDLASLLPAIAKGLSEKADAATELDEISKYVDLTREALVLCSNSKYLPGRLRDEKEFNQIDQVLARIALRQVALKNLKATLEEMNNAVAASDTRTAYAAHARFVKAHPEKAADPDLVAAVAATSEAEQAGIEFVEARVPAETTEPETAITASVATASQRRTAEAPANGVTVVRFQGGAYAFNRRTGSLLWRRPVGVSLQRIDPVRVGEDCLLVDSARQELARVNATTGELIWRAPLNDNVAQPTLMGRQVLAAGESGKLYVLDAATGEQRGYVQFAQKLRTAPVVYADAKRVYLVGEHSSVYSLDATNLDCLGVYYLGHADGSVVATPVVVLNRVVVVENDGAATSSLHVFGLDENGAVETQLNAADADGTRLSGLVTQAPEVFGNRFAITTGNGSIGVYQASAESGADAVTLLATRSSRRRLRSTPYTAVADKQLWVAGMGLARYSIQPSGNRLPVRDVEEPCRGDTFVHPLSVADGVVIHVRRRRGRAGATVAASDRNTGELYWETDIAAPAAGPPVATANGNQLLYATATGDVFVIDQEAIGSGVASKRVITADLESSILLDSSAADDGSAVYASSQSVEALGVGGPSSRVHPLRLPGALSSPPVRFGDGWLGSLAIGQLLYFDGQTGETLAAPFQPELEPGKTLDWQEPGIASLGNRSLAVVADGRSNLYTLELLSSPIPNLAPIADYALESGTFSTRVAAVDEKVAVANSDNKLMLFRLETLELIGEVELTSSVVWGPYAAGGKWLLATAEGQLLAVDPGDLSRALWQAPIDAFQLTGAPRDRGDSVVLSLHRGALEERNLADGQLLGRTDLMQPLAASPTRVAGRYVVATLDGALLFVDGQQER